MTVFDRASGSGRSATRRRERIDVLDLLDAAAFGLTISAG